MAIVDNKVIPLPPSYRSNGNVSKQISIHASSNSRTAKTAQSQNAARIHSGRDAKLD